MSPTQNFSLTYSNYRNYPTRIPDYAYEQMAVSTEFLVFDAHKDHGVDFGAKYLIQLGS